MTNLKHFISIASIVASAIAANAETLTLVTGEEKLLSETGWNWGNTAMWSPSVEQVSGANDLTIDAKTTTEINSAISDGFTANNVSIALNQAAPAGSVGGNGHFNVNFEGNVTFNNFDFKTTSAAWWGSYLKIKTGSTLTVQNDLNIAYNGSNTFFVNFASNADANHMGNLAVNGSISVASNGGASTHVFRTELNSLSVAKAITMTGLYSTSAVRWRIDVTQSTIGGLSGESTRTHQIYLDKNSTINFTNKSDYSWNGALTDNSNVTDNTKTLDVIMDSTATASQKLTLTVGSLNNVSVNGGKFILSNATASTGKLSINGGTYESAGATTFANIDLTAGAIAFSDTANIISITGNAQKLGMDKFAIDFEDLSVDSLKDNSNWYDILSISGIMTGFSDNANDDFFAKNLSNALANFRWDNGNLQVSFTQVPEPSTIAALFALAAFGIVLARKRS